MNTDKCGHCPHHSGGVCFYQSPAPIEDLDDCPDEFVQVWKISEWIAVKKGVPSELVGSQVKTTEKAILIEIKNFEDKDEVWIPKSQINDTYMKKKVI